MKGLGKSSKRIGGQLCNMSHINQKRIRVVKFPIHADEFTLEVLYRIWTSGVPTLVTIINQVGLVEVKGSELGY
jgi:hypothetical protein